ncbi:hypothetical protein HYX08_03200 [Candidatus Woesearchaeota archaeon]|nr:hypothetical protein [Candidatus Woesearchaeota archaeon]
MAIDSLIRLATGKEIQSATAVSETARELVESGHQLYIGRESGHHPNHYWLLPRKVPKNDTYVFDVDNNINEAIGNLLIHIKKFLSEAEKVGFGKISTKVVNLTVSSLAYLSNNLSEQLMVLNSGRIGLDGQSFGYGNRGIRDDVEYMRSIVAKLLTRTIPSKKTEPLPPFVTYPILSEDFRLRANTLVEFFDEWITPKYSPENRSHL